jgi:hypothetical protein
MTISTQTSKAAFSGNGVSTVFPLPFPFLRDADIKALLRQDGFETPLEQGAHYTLSGAGGALGGSLTMLVPPATGQTLVAWRAPAMVQEVDYVENSAFPAETHEAALDLLTMLCQSLQEQLGRAVLYPVSTPAEDIVDSATFLAATAADKNAARASEQSAAVSAGLAAEAAVQTMQKAAAVAELIATADGLVKVSAGDSAGRSLSAKLLAGNGLAEGIENPGGDETLRLSMALAESSGLEFATGLLRVRAGSGLTLSASGLAADAGLGAGKLVQLDAQGRLPALDGCNLTGIATGDASARDNAAMNAFLTHLTADRDTGPLPGGGIWLFATDELTRTGATYDAANKRYANAVTLGADIVPTLTGPTGGTFTVSATSSYGGSYPAWQAFNGSAAGNSSWIAGAANGTLTVDFGGVSYTVGGVTLHCDDEPTRGPKDFTIQVYDGSAWLTAYTASGLAWTANETKALTFPAVSCKGLRVVVAAIYGGDLAEINEMEILPVASVADMSLSSPSGVALGLTPAKATVYLLHKGIGSLAYNTDVKVKAGKGAGAWAQSTDLAKLCAFDSTYDLLKASIDLRALPAGQTGCWGLDTYNAKQQQVRAALVLFD